MNDLNDSPNTYECVEPEVGREMWRLGQSGASTSDLKLHADHLLICDACRLEAAVGQAIGNGLATGALNLPETRSRVVRRGRSLRVPATLAAAALGLAAAGLILMVMLPPTGLVVPGADRSGASTGFERPVAGETIAGNHSQYRWQPIPGASSYLVRIEEVAGDFVWEGTSHGTSLTLPPDITLPAGRELRAYIITVPRDVAPAGDLSVRFRSGDRMAILKYRTLAAPWPAQLLILIGFLLGIGAAVLRYRASRFESATAT